MNALVIAEGKQLDLIRRTVAKDCNPAEFDQFIHICKAVRLDPLRRQIYAFVFSKDDPTKRQMTIVTAIGGYRAIADRTGNYRPGPTNIVYHEKIDNPALNPVGIEYAEATVFKYSHGEWHPVTERAYWDEFAPIKEIWSDKKPTGKFELDRKKDGWRRMSRVMIEKVAEAKALRRAWPDDFAGLEIEEEADRRFTIDASASELADEAAAAKRFEAIGGANALTIDWCDGGELRREPVGTFGDKVLAFISENRESPMTVRAFHNRNVESLKEYWAKDKAGALELKKAFEGVEQMEAAE
jgi:phage recombination protein Bet